MPEPLGEDALLARIVPRLPTGSAALVGPGDDAALLAAPDGRVVATVDMLVEHRDFRLDWSSAADVGWKAAAQNLADVAAMGAEPTALLVALGLPAHLPPSWPLDLADGLAAACAGTGAGVVGGDLSGADAVTVAVTALGNLNGRSPVLRSGARAGDVVALSGRLGWAAAGLDLLQAGLAGLAGLAGVAGTPDADVAAAVEATVDAQRRPRPPYAAGPRAADAGATAMLDVSDGLLRDLGRLARASGVGVDLAAADVEAAAQADSPGVLVAAARALGARTDAEQAHQVRRWVLGGAEDHALAATFPADVPLPEGFVAVGTVMALPHGDELPDGDDPPFVLVDGAPPDVPLGWDHFRR